MFARFPFAGTDQIRFQELVVLIPPLSYSLPQRDRYSDVG